MSLFLSNYTNKVDKKLRVSVPSQFRSAVNESKFQGVIIYPSIVNDCIEGCSLERLGKITEMIDNLDPFSDEKDAFATAILGQSCQLAFDPEGRISLPAHIAESINITDNAIFIGKGSTFEIWNPDTFAKYIASAKDIAFKNRDKIRVIK